jgi:hypothetical protein
MIRSIGNGLLCVKKILKQKILGTENFGHKMLGTALMTPLNLFGNIRSIEKFLLLLV